MTITTKPLGALCTLTMGRTPSRGNSKYWDQSRTTNNFWISIADMTKSAGRTLTDSKEYLSDEGSKTFPKVKKGTLLLSFKLSIGKLAIAGTELQTNEAIVAMNDLNEDAIIRDYLYYYLLGFDWSEALKGRFKVKGNTLNKKILEELLIQFPSVEKQHEIVKRLDEAFIEIASLTNQNESHLGLLKQIYNQEIESNFHRNINKWPETTIEQTCEYKNGKAHEQLVNPTGQYRLVTSKFVSSDGLSARRVTEALTPLVSGDVAFVLSDLPNGKALAKAFLVSNEADLTLNQRVLRVRSKKFDPNFLYLMINRNPYLRSFDNGESQTHLKLAQVLACPLFMPDLETQKEVSKVISELKHQVDIAVQILTKKALLLNDLKNAILNSTLNQPERIEVVG
jgi:type I restriction enzyme S subunit